MKPNEQKDLFILKRAEGKSYSTIAKELCISKSTCTEWERELKDQIANKRAEQLEDLYDTYFMTKRGRIEKIGASLAKIEDALAQADLSSVSPDKLLDLKLKYQEALRAEHIPVDKGDALPTNATAKDIYGAFVKLTNRVIAGEIDKDKAQQEQATLTALLKAYDSVETQKRLDAIEALLGGR